MMEKRGSLRHNFRRRILYGPSIPPEHMSYAKDLSDNGVSIIAENLFDPGTMLHMTIRDENRYFKTVGIVTRTFKNNQSQSKNGSGMGVRFVQMNDELMGLYEQLMSSQQA